MPQEPTQALAEFAVGLRHDDLPGKVREHCKLLLLAHLEIGRAHV